MLAITKGRYAQRLSESRALRQEYNQYGKRKAKPLAVKVIRRRNGQDTVIVNLKAG